MFEWQENCLYYFFQDVAYINGMCAQDIAIAIRPLANLVLMQRNVWPPVSKGIAVIKHYYTQTLLLLLWILHNCFTHFDGIECVKSFFNGRAQLVARRFSSHIKSLTLSRLGFGSHKRNTFTHEGLFREFLGAFTHTLLA